MSSTVYSLEYRRGNLLLASECWHGKTRVKNTIGGLPFPVPDMPVAEDEQLAYYAQAAYRFAEWFQLSGYYSEFYSDKNDKDGKRYEMRGQPAYMAWTKDLALTARFDISSHWLIKLEAHHLDGTDILYATENPVVDEQNWNMFLARATFHF